MHPIPSRFSEEYWPGPVTLHMDDLQAILAILTEEGQTPEIMADMNSPDASKGSLTHWVESLDELHTAHGRRLRRALRMTGDSDVILAFHPVLGMHLVAESAPAALEPKFRKVAEYLRHRRRWFAVLTKLPLWAYAAVLLTLCIPGFSHGVFSPSWHCWASIAVFGLAFFGRLKWGSGAMSIILLLSRSQAEDEKLHKTTARREQLYAAGIGAIVTALVGLLLTSACPMQPKDPVNTSPTNAPAKSDVSPGRGQ
jgi:hypothetical protein